MSADDKQMKLRYAGICRLCGAELAARAKAIYERSTKTVRCLDCSPADLAPSVVEEGARLETPTPSTSAPRVLRPAASTNAVRPSARPASVRSTPSWAASSSP